MSSLLFCRAGGSNNWGQITQRSSQLPRKRSSLPKTQSATSALRWSLVHSTNGLIILFNSRHVRVDSDATSITWGMEQHFSVVFVDLLHTPKNALKLGVWDAQEQDILQNLNGAVVMSHTPSF